MAGSKKEVIPTIINAGGDYVAGDQAKGNTNSQINQGGQGVVVQTQTNSQIPEELNKAFDALENFIKTLNNPTALNVASQLKQEAQKPSPSKGTLSALWGILTTSVPELGSTGLAFVQAIQAFITQLAS